MMTQLAKFMVHHHHAFGDEGLSRAPRDKGSSAGPHWSESDQGRERNSKGLNHYLEAAENILAVVNACRGEHVRFVNAFLASTIWLAAAVQLVYMAFGQEESKKDLVESKFDILRIHCQQYTKFWNTPLALLQNLDSMKAHLGLTPPYLSANGESTMQDQTKCRDGIELRMGQICRYR
jgi:hypothetical protein